MKKLAIFMLVGMAAVLALSACGGGEDPMVAMCEALTELNETAPKIAALGEVADLAQIVQLGAALDNSWKDLSTAVEKSDDAELQATFAPFNDQYVAIPAITQETAMPVARASLDAKNGIATQAYDAIYPAHCQ